MRRREPSVVGLDLSLRSPAAVLIPAGWELGNWHELSWWSGNFPPPAPGDLAGQYARLLHITKTVVDFVVGSGATDVFVENYAFSASSTSVTKLAELGGAVRVALWRAEHLVRPVVASQARKLLLGKLPKEGAKVAVQRALYAHGAPFTNDDECDAFAVANLGLSELGLTAMTLAG